MSSMNLEKCRLRKTFYSQSRLRADRQNILGNVQTYLYIEETDSKTELPGLLLKHGERIEQDCQLVEKLTAPVKKGEVVGNIRYVVDGVEWKTLHLKTAKFVPAIDFAWCIQKIFNTFLAFG